MLPDDLAAFRAQQPALGAAALAPLAAGDAIDPVPGC
jgi:hypothetical protein